MNPQKNKPKPPKRLPVITSRAEWEAERLAMLAMAIAEYAKQKQHIPAAWVNEYNELAERLGKLNEHPS